MTDATQRPLFNDAATFGTNYHGMLMDQYKLYVEMADRISQRRAIANTFLLTVNSALVTAYGLVPAAHDKGLIGLWIYVVPAAGLVVSVTWFMQVLGYKSLNTAKYQVIHKLEAALPARLYDIEWDLLQRGKTLRYVPLSHLELAVPIVFAGFYAAFLVTK